MIITLRRRQFYAKSDLIKAHLVSEGPIELLLPLPFEDDSVHVHQLSGVPSEIIKYL